MKLILEENILDQAPESLLRQAGYVYLMDGQSGQESYVRRLGRSFYPRFHLYLEKQPACAGRNGQVIFNLHLDQKQPSYAGAHAHNAEYDGELVAEEIARIKTYVPGSFKF